MKTEETRHKEIRKCISGDTIIHFNLINQIDKYTQSEVHTSNARIYVRSTILIIVVLFIMAVITVLNLRYSMPESYYIDKQHSDYLEMNRLRKENGSMNRKLQAISINYNIEIDEFDLNNLDSKKNYDIAHRNVKKEITIKK